MKEILQDNSEFKETIITCHHCLSIFKVDTLDELQYCAPNSWRYSDQVLVSCPICNINNCISVSYFIKDKLKKIEQLKQKQKEKEEQEEKEKQSFNELKNEKVLGDSEVLVEVPNFSLPEEEPIVVKKNLGLFEKIYIKLLS